MSREILFRGKTNDGQWLEGDLIQYAGTSQIWVQTDEGKWNFVIDPATVGQYTGLCDKNGVKIFEGDIIKAYDGDVMYICYEKTFASFGLHKQGWAFLHYFNEAVKPGDCEVIGNIYDNPELLGEIE